MIRVIIPFAAGGTSSVIVRYITDKLSVALGQPIVVENRVGANGTIGLAQGLRAEPDGYTLIQVSNTNTVAAIHMVRNLPFDPLTRHGRRSVRSTRSPPWCSRRRTFPPTRSQSS